MGDLAYTLRPHRDEDMAWVVARHGEIYDAEFGWDKSFEALVADIATEFVQNFDPEREAGWIAEIDGRRVGCVFLVRHADAVGQLRMLIVEPSGRGLGIGRRLVAECVARAREVGYERLILWTVASLDPARRLYEAAGFALASEEPLRAWGHDHLSQMWELRL